MMKVSSTTTADCNRVHTRFGQRASHSCPAPRDLWRKWILRLWSVETTFATRIEKHVGYEVKWTVTCGSGPHHIPGWVSGKRPRPMKVRRRNTSPGKWCRRGFDSLFLNRGCYIWRLFPPKNISCCLFWTLPTPSFLCSHRLHSFNV